MPSIRPRALSPASKAGRGAGGRSLSACLLGVWLLFGAGTSYADRFDLSYHASINPERGEALVEIRLDGEDLPSRLRFHIDGERHSDFRSDDGELSEPDGDIVIWHPEGERARLSYRFQINHRRDGGRYDSRITEDWASLRSDKLIPPISARMPKGLSSRATLTFDLPQGWSAAAPYEKLDSDHPHFALDDPGRRFVRPKGWLILGNISSRMDSVAGVDIRVAAPRGQGSRLQDTLAFIRWTLPFLRDIFPDFPDRILVVGAGNPMWRGGLSSPNSLFMHADRPLISGNRTSSLIHELVHIGTSIRGTRRSDWIVEGIAEFYAVEILRRSGAISEQRYQETLHKLDDWGESSAQLFTGDSSGATTARAVGVMARLDREIRQRSGGNKSLDEVATALAEQGGTISVADFINHAEAIAGGPLDTLAPIRARLAQSEN